MISCGPLPNLSPDSHNIGPRKHPPPVSVALHVLDPLLAKPTQESGLRHAELFGRLLGDVVAIGGQADVAAGGEDVAEQENRGSNGKTAVLLPIRTDGVDEEEAEAEGLISG